MMFAYSGQLALYSFFVVADNNWAMPCVIYENVVGLSAAVVCSTSKPNVNAGKSVAGQHLPKDHTQIAGQMEFARVHIIL